MSGGHFEYQQYRINDIASQIKELIESNDDESLNEWGCRRGYGYSAETIEKFKTAVYTLNKAAIMAQRVDWLVSGDDGEDNFHRRWEKELNELEEEKQ
jgi:hypothetical protein